MDRIPHPPARPFSLAEALQLLRHQPDSIILSGGTHSYSGKPYSRAQRYPLPQVISLDRIEELRRISRTDRYLEFGAGVTLQRILQLGSNVLPHPLRSCLREIGTPGMRRLATIGGNLMIPESAIGLGIVLATLEGSVEIRHANGSRRLTAARMYTLNSVDAGELVTRIRIPNRMPTHAIYQRFGSPYDRTTHPLGICATADLEKSSVESFSFLTGDVNRPLIRNRELEADIVGQRVPFTDREHQGFQARWRKTLQSYELSEIQVERSARIFARFLIILGGSRLAQPS